MWAAVAGIAAIVGTIIAAYSVYQQGQAQKKASNYQAQVAENQAAWAEYNAAAERDAYAQQAQIYEMNAQMAEDDAAEKARQASDYKERLLGAQTARYGKAGVAMEGTPLDVMAQTALEADKSIETILYEGGVEAWNWRNKGEAAKRGMTMSELRGASTSDVFKSEASLNLLKGSQAESAGIFGAGSTILTGLSQAATVYDKGKVPKYPDTRGVGTY